MNKNIITTHHADAIIAIIAYADSVLGQAMSSVCMHGKELKAHANALSVISVFGGDVVWSVRPGVQPDNSVHTSGLSGWLALGQPRDDHSHFYGQHKLPHHKLRNHNYAGNMNHVTASLRFTPCTKNNKNRN